VWKKENNLSNNYRLIIKDKDNNILFISCFIIWKDSILIETLQYTKYFYKKYQSKEKYKKFHRLWIGFGFFILKKLKKIRLYAFSDKNHPYSYHKWFFPVYDNFFKLSGFIYSNGYYYFDWKIKNKYIKYLNFFEYNILNIIKE
jgi:hypothetical protein